MTECYECWRLRQAEPGSGAASQPQLTRVCCGCRTSCTSRWHWSAAMYTAQDAPSILRLVTTGMPMGYKARAAPRQALWRIAACTPKLCILQWRFCNCICQAQWRSATVYAAMVTCTYMQDVTNLSTAWQRVQERRERGAPAVHHRGLLGDPAQPRLPRLQVHQPWRRCRGERVLAHPADAAPGPAPPAQVSPLPPPSPPPRSPGLQGWRKRVITLVDPTGPVFQHFKMGFRRASRCWVSS